MNVEYLISYKLSLINLMYLQFDLQQITIESNTYDDNNADHGKEHNANLKDVSPYDSLHPTLKDKH